jgi:hypothetical protein
LGFKQQRTGFNCGFTWALIAALMSNKNMLLSAGKLGPATLDRDK